MMEPFDGFVFRDRSDVVVRRRRAFGSGGSEFVLRIFGAAPPPLSLPRNAPIPRGMRQIQIIHGASVSGKRSECFFSSLKGHGNAGTEGGYDGKGEQHRGEEAVPFGLVIGSSVVGVVMIVLGRGIVISHQSGTQRQGTPQDRFDGDQHRYEYGDGGICVPYEQKDGGMRG